MALPSLSPKGACRALQPTATDMNILKIHSDAGVLSVSVEDGDFVLLYPNQERRTADLRCQGLLLTMITGYLHHKHESCSLGFTMPAGRGHLARYDRDKIRALIAIAAEEAGEDREQVSADELYDDRDRKVM